MTNNYCEKTLARYSTLYIFATTKMILIMKKLVLSIALLLASSFSDIIAQITDENSGKGLVLHTSIIDPTKDKGPIKRSPVRNPPISIVDHTLYFKTPYNGCVLHLFDENGEFQYSTIIPEDATSINLPAYLTGEYEIQIIRGNSIIYSLIITL